MNTSCILKNAYIHRLPFVWNPQVFADVIQDEHGSPKRISADTDEYVKNGLRQHLASAINKSANMLGYDATVLPSDLEDRFVNLCIDKLAHPDHPITGTAIPSVLRRKVPRTLPADGPTLGARRFTDALDMVPTPPSRRRANTAPTFESRHHADRSVGVTYSHEIKSPRLRPPSVTTDELRELMLTSAERAQHAETFLRESHAASRASLQAVMCTNYAPQQNFIIGLGVSRTMVNYLAQYLGIPHENVVVTKQGGIGVHGKHGHLRRKKIASAISAVIGATTVHSLTLVGHGHLVKASDCEHHPELYEHISQPVLNYLTSIDLQYVLADLDLESLESLNMMSCGRLDLGKELASLLPVAPERVTGVDSDWYIDFFPTPRKITDETVMLAWKETAPRGRANLCLENHQPLINVLSRVERVESLN